MERTVGTEFFTERDVDVQKRQCFRVAGQYASRRSFLELHKPGKFLPGLSGYDSFYQSVTLAQVFSCTGSMPAR
jgi:hypothetical protein